MNARGRIRAHAGAALVAVALAVSSCGPDFVLSVTDLDIGPDPARPGESVSFVFQLTLVPEQRFTVTVLIDGNLHTTVSRDRIVAGPLSVNVGDAADLIASYGEGTHTGYIEVRLDESGKSARTADKTFQLLAQ